MESHCDIDCPKAPIACNFSTFGCKERVRDHIQIFYTLLKRTILENVVCYTTISPISTADQMSQRKIVCLRRCSATTWLSTCRSSHRVTCATWPSSCVASASTAPHPNPCGRYDPPFPPRIKELRRRRPVAGPEELRAAAAAAATVPRVSPMRPCRVSGRWTDGWYTRITSCVSSSS